MNIIQWFIELWTWSGENTNKLSENFDTEFVIVVYNIVLLSKLLSLEVVDVEVLLDEGDFSLLLKSNL